MKTTLEIPDSLFEEAKRTAARQNVPLRQMVETALRQYLKTQRASKPFRLREHTFKGEGLASGADWPTIRSLIYEGHGG